MKIGKVQSNIAFKRALTADEMPEYKDTLRKAKELISGGNDGKSILIVHDACLPQDALTDTGIGHLTSKSANSYFDFAKNYLGINTIEVLPQGEIQLRHGKQFYNSYNGSALSLGTHTIDLELLTQPEFNSILSKEDFQKVVDSNKTTIKEGFVNFENVVGENSAQETALKKAYKNFIARPEIDKTPFEQFKQSNMDWLEKRAVYEVLKRENGEKEWTDWASEVDKTLYDSPNNKAATQRLSQIKTQHTDDINFSMFKQFMAEEHLKLGRKNINDKGSKLIGDCLIGFSQDEVWGNKKAFMSGVYVGDAEWKLPALDYKNITDANSEAQKLLRRKVSLFAQRYDGIRFDCSWAYVEPKLSNKTKYDFKGSLLDIIEDTVKQVKGDKFNPKDLIHEFEAGEGDFSIFDNTGNIKEYLAKRVKVISSAYLSDEYGSAAKMKELGAELDDFVIGVGNHDPQPLRQLAQNMPDIGEKTLSYRKAQQEKALQKIFGVSAKDVSSPTDFSKYKFAEPLSAKNNMVFYMDVMGRVERFDAQSMNGWANYRYRESVDFLKAHQKAIQEGFGYNPMDGYEKVFRLKKLDESHSELYKKIVKFRDILTEKSEQVIKNVKDKSPSLAKNKLFNFGAVALAIGLIGLILAKTKSEIDKINSK